MSNVLKIDVKDNLIIALKDLTSGQSVWVNHEEFILKTDVKQKHKFTTCDINAGEILWLYGVPVAKALEYIPRGAAITTGNVKHYAEEIKFSDESYQWTAPDVSKWQNRTFKGVIRDDGRVGTANYWLIIPLVFCENRNVEKLTRILNDQLGYTNNDLKRFAEQRIGGGSPSAIQPERPFKHIDGIRGITVSSGCGGAASDSMTMCDVLAAYADHPNVAGVTVFALGCEKAQVANFRASLDTLNPNFTKPLLYFKQQDWRNEEEMMQEALLATYEQLRKVPATPRQDVPLSRLKIGVKCGASDGFSGISANPAMGVVSDWLVTLGGASGLAEFPELCGAEADIVKRCDGIELKEKFISLMRNYEKAANFFKTTIADNPSPGNIADGLITDAIKSAGAAKKGGRAPIHGVCNYAEKMPDAGLSLVCTPGNDVEAVTGLVAAGCNVVIFSTGLGTPTGNPIVPVLKISTNSELADKLSDIIDFDCGPIINGAPMTEIGEQLLERVIEAASGDYEVKADRLGQHDFMLWKRSVDL